MDEITGGTEWALAKNPLDFDCIGGSSYFAVVRGFDNHPDLLIIFTVDLDLGLCVLQWIGVA